MEWEYPLEFVGGHPVILVDDVRRGLVDTGSPISVPTPGVPVSVAGLELEVGLLNLVLDMDWVSGKIGVRIDFVLGMDVIGNRSMVVDAGRGVVRFGDGPLPIEGPAITVGSLMAVPTMKVEVGGRTIDGLFDTGAPLSYGDPEVLEDHEPVGEVEDFHPLEQTEFRTPVFMVPVTLAGVTRTIRMGRLPSLLRVGRYSWIIGPEFFGKGLLGLDMRAGRLVVGPGPA